MEIMSLKDMRMTPKEAGDYYCPSPMDAPLYPPGLCIYLCGDELEKLGIDYDELCVGDILHLHALAMITSKTCSERQGGDPNERIEVQITHLAGLEDEDDEDEMAEQAMSKAKKALGKLYKDK